MTQMESSANYKKKASVTVTFTLVLTMIISMLLVTLEHAYAKSGHVIVYETLNKALESVLGNYSAPLYTQYGIFALPVAKNEKYQTTDMINSEIVSVISASLGSDAGSKNGFVYQVNGVESKINGTVKLTDDNLYEFKKQLKDAALADAAVYLGEDISKLNAEDFKSLSGLLNGISGNKIEFEKDEKKQTDDEKDAENLYNDLLNFLKMGFASLWFEDVSEISKNAVYSQKLPSVKLKGEIVYSSLYDELDIDEESILDGSYVDELVNDSYLKKFSDIINEKVTYAADDILLATYASRNMDNYIHDKVDGELKYEQEYIVFGHESDSVNIKQASWAIFGIRLAANLIFILSDDAIKNSLKSIIAAAIADTPLGIAILALLGIVLAVENAVVETAAILKGKSVNFIPTAVSQCVHVTEIFSFTKRFVRNKAANYTSSQGISLGYQTYMFIFMLISGPDVTIKRIMDIIDINMKKIYNKNFDILNCYVGFGCTAQVKLRSRFFNTSVSGVKKDYYKLRVNSAVKMPEAVF